METTKVAATLEEPFLNKNESVSVRPTTKILRVAQKVVQTKRKIGQELYESIPGETRVCKIKAKKDTPLRPCPLRFDLSQEGALSDIDATDKGTCCYGNKYATHYIKCMRCKNKWAACKTHCDERSHLYFEKCMRCNKGISKANPNKFDPELWDEFQKMNMFRQLWYLVTQKQTPLERKREKERAQKREQKQKEMVHKFYGRPFAIKP
ncbi:MAG: hypothetical protein ACTSUE_07630 [Promethearchaeota archaeon]